MTPLSSDQHLFQLFGRFFLLDAPSGSLMALDEEAYLVLTGQRPASAEVAEEIETLKAQGLLQPDPLSMAPPEQTGNKRLKALCLHVAHDCNLRCTYCFAGGGTFGGGRQRMMASVARGALDLLLRESGPIKQLEVDFFGGEPLLALDTVKDAVAYGRQQAAALGKRINFTLTTNAVLLDPPALAYLNEQGISLVLSLDGRPATHNRFRPDAGGAGSYERATRGILPAIQSRHDTNYYVRGTFTRANLDFCADVKHLLSLGITRLSLEPVVCAPDAGYAIREEDLPVIEAEYEKLADLYLECARSGRGFVFFHFEVDLDRGPCPAKRLSGCGAGQRYLAVTPDGELYPCHQFVGRSEYLMGDLQSGIVRPDLTEAFNSADIWHKNGCLQCWARYFCGGGCHANAVLRHGDLSQPDAAGCRLLRKRLECALAIKAMQPETD